MKAEFICNECNHIFEADSNSSGNCPECFSKALFKIKDIEINNPKSIIRRK